MSVIEWLERNMKDRRQINSERRIQLHSCYEWDGLIIDNTKPEFDACLCYTNQINLQRSGSDRRGDK